MIFLVGWLLLKAAEVADSIRYGPPAPKRPPSKESWAMPVLLGFLALLGIVYFVAKHTGA